MTQKNVGKFAVSGGNVFADLILADTPDDKIKFLLIGNVGAIIKERRLTQDDAAEVLRITPHRVYELVNGQLDKFTLDEILVFFVKLGRVVEISVKSQSNDDVFDYEPCINRSRIEIRP